MSVGASDAPTAWHLPLLNVYNNTVRRSAPEPPSEHIIDLNGAITPSQAVLAATLGAAYSRFAELWLGNIAKDHRADFVVLETE